MLGIGNITKTRGRLSPPCLTRISAPQKGLPHEALFVYPPSSLRFHSRPGQSQCQKQASSQARKDLYRAYGRRPSPIHCRRDQEKESPAWSEGKPSVLKQSRQSADTHIEPQFFIRTIRISANSAMRWRNSSAQNALRKNKAITKILLLLMTPSFHDAAIAGLSGIITQLRSVGWNLLRARRPVTTISRYETNDNK